ncbi:MAG TPA: hypothetical protein VFK78_11410 [Gemmatimonadales bacterium]|nr:hypothetical protein [Gemmatimonadales bacterium]
MTINLEPSETALVTRILDFYLEELRKAARDSSRLDLRDQLSKEEPLLKDLLSQLVSAAA